MPSGIAKCIFLASNTLIKNIYHSMFSECFMQSLGENQPTNILIVTGYIIILNVLTEDYLGQSVEEHLILHGCKLYETSFSSTWLNHHSHKTSSMCFRRVSKFNMHPLQLLVFTRQSVRCSCLFLLIYLLMYRFQES